MCAITQTTPQLAVSYAPKWPKAKPLDGTKTAVKPFNKALTVTWLVRGRTGLGRFPRAATCHGGDKWQGEAALNNVRGAVVAVGGTLIGVGLLLTLFVSGFVGIPIAASVGSCWSSSRLGSRPDSGLGGIVLVVSAARL